MNKYQHTSTQYEQISTHMNKYEQISNNMNKYQ